MSSNIWLATVNLITVLYIVVVHRWWGQSGDWIANARAKKKCHHGEFFGSPPPSRIQGMLQCLATFTQRVAALGDLKPTDSWKHYMIFHFVSPGTHDKRISHTVHVMLHTHFQVVEGLSGFPQPAIEAILSAMEVGPHALQLYLCNWIQQYVTCSNKMSQVCGQIRSRVIKGGKRGKLNCQIYCNCFFCSFSQNLLFPHLFVFGSKKLQNAKLVIYSSLCLFIFLA